MCVFVYVRACACVLRMLSEWAEEKLKLVWDLWEVRFWLRGMRDESAAHHYSAGCLKIQRGPLRRTKEAQR